jgi:photosynthetic reaction center cytochrome c subunit
MNRISFRLMATLLGIGALLAGCERPRMDSTQTGYRGVAMGKVSNPRVVGPIQAAQPLPAPIQEIPSPPGSPLAKDTFKNVKLLGHLPVGEFTRTMMAITAWVAPKEGCNYCHVPGEDLSLDTLYTKQVSRKMLEMTLRINNDWQSHVAQTGVTCYTCHRGQPVPARIWYSDPGPKQAGGAAAQGWGQNHPSRAAGLTALAVDPVTPYLSGAQAVRVEGTTALPSGMGASLKTTEATFGLMFHISDSLGVNCTHCHNTRNFADWGQSPMARTTAFQGIRMARELNNSYLEPLAKVFPAKRLGPTGDVPKVSCATCHQGQYKPLNGAPLLKDHPALGGGKPATVADATVVPAAAVAPVVATR